MTLVIIGGGPAGYVAAITAARFGREVVLIDQGQLGGPASMKAVFRPKHFCKAPICMSM